ncbi:hypothetical protein FXO38_34604 [Capsicum annuum]|nr:hypothetical protein FXO38_34604 [Capsicum annuum]KAF3621773.1 hypothetical protein FXO37_32608 [Capsicum annuum]
MLRIYKWENSEGRGIYAGVTMLNEDIISIKDPPSDQSEVLKRSLVGEFNVVVPLSEVRKWSSSLWKQTHGVNIYDMGRSFFLFEFTSKQIAKQVMEGVWEWKKSPVKLAWWNPLVGTVEGRNKPVSIWIKIVGLPLHLWSQKVFKAIGDCCGGWIETEEETTLRNHLRWARIRVRSDGSSIPKEIKVERDGIIFELQIWTELPPKFYVREGRNPNSLTQQSVGRKPSGKEASADSDKFLKGTRPKTCEETSDVAESSGAKNWALTIRNKHVGLTEYLGQSPLEADKSPLIKETCDQHMDSLNGLKVIKDLAENFISAFKSWELSSAMEKTERKEENPSTIVLPCIWASSKGHSHEGDETIGQSEANGKLDEPCNLETREADLQIQQIHEPHPVNMQSPIKHEAVEIDTPSWVNLHILELSNTYGVAFEGFESETLALLMRIDERKMAIENIKLEKSNTTPKSRGIGKNELKNLQSSLNKEVEGARNRGRNLSLTFK